MAHDDIRALSEALAADPSSIAFLPLAEALRKRGDVEMAWRIATRGVERHSQRPDAHDLVARIALDRGDLARARAEWETVLTLQPANPGAQKGLGFLFFQQGDLAEAERYLGAAAAAAPDDQSLAAALGTVRAAAADVEHEAFDWPTPGTPLGNSVLPVPPFAPAPADARTLFAEVLGHEPQTALLIDAEGYVVAGEYVTDDGHDLGADLGAQLSGVSDEASRAMRHLGLGAWQQIVFEAEAASVAMAPSGDGVLLVAAPRTVPLGFVRRLLERSLDRARRWLASGT
jgi:predicted regulator of Ras-like GTPase activity (Roadblock/LC7/MglB family)